MKKRLLKFKLALIVLLLPVLALPQSIKSVRINEIQVYNTDGYRDKYGQASGWIELHNGGFGKVNIAGCTLKIKDKEYYIPKKDPATLIPVKGYLVFFAAGTPDKGTFHTNFTLDNTDFIEFYNADGKLIDRFEFNPANIRENVSYGWSEDNGRTEKLMHRPATTPGSCNNTIEKIPRSELFRLADPTGTVLTLICIVAVTIDLTLLFFVFKYMGNFHVRVAKKRAAKKKAGKTGVDQVESNKVTSEKIITNDELAAIAIALYKYSKHLHDTAKSAHIIKRATKSHSLWGSKIYTLRQFPNIRFKHGLQSKNQRRGI
jgi:Na+-transporting methylmalonyl-CoA/oxaloacetate decarboxylase gamma subunit